MAELDGAEVRAFADAAAFEGWLAEHHGRQQGVWVKVARKASGLKSVTSDELVDVGLCFGWISGQRRGLDERHYLQKYLPRRPRSVWSQVNVEKAEALIAEGRMREPGLAEIARAQQDGRWDAAYASQRTAEPPPDLLARLATDPAAARAFATLHRTARYQLILPLLKARTQPTRTAALDRALRSLSGP